MDPISRVVAAGAAGAGGDITPEAFFSPTTYTGNNGTQSIDTGIDLAGEGGMVWIKMRSGGSVSVAGTKCFDTVRGVNNMLNLSTVTIQQSISDTLTSFNSDGFSLGSVGKDHGLNDNGTEHVAYCWRKLDECFDIVTYTGNGTARTISHNLGVAPDLMIVKTYLQYTDGAAVYQSVLGNTKYDLLHDNGIADTSSAYWNNTSPTSSVFTVGTQDRVNRSGNTYVAYLFAHKDKFFKTGTFSGSGSSINIDCGFDASARFVMIKRTSSYSSPWQVWDTARGISTGNDSYHQINTGNGWVTNTDLIEPFSTGFTVNSGTASVNVSGSDYVYWAFA